MTESDDAVVSIHGSEWKLSDVQAAVDKCRESTWEYQRWRCRPALVDRRGTKMSLYVGQKYDAEKTRLEPEGWDHDHCEICWWTLTESDDPERAFGYVSADGAWLCLECHDRFIQMR